MSSKFSRSNIIAVDYRGFGDSGKEKKRKEKLLTTFFFFVIESTPNEAGLRLDAQAVLRWLNDRKGIYLYNH